VSYGPWAIPNDPRIGERALERLEEHGDEVGSDVCACSRVMAELDAYERDDPKHPDYHSTHADLWDAREGK
jgi:hypothetical protein